MDPKLPLLLHALLEAAAAASFTLTPTTQLPTATGPAGLEARLILRSYGGLLLSSSVLCAGFYFRPGFDSATRLVAGSMAVYHLFPIGRAVVGIREGLARGKGKGGKEGPKAFGGPVVHLLVHLVALGGLVGSVLGAEDRA